MTSSNMQEATPHPQKFVDEAREIVNQFGLDADGDTKVTNHDIAYLIDLIALALSLAEARGRLAGLEEACKAICPLCDRAVKFSNNYPDTHLVGHELQDCDARKIRSRQRSSK